MRTEPIGLDYLLPVGVARIVAAVAALVLLGIIYLLISSFTAAPHRWADAVRLVVMGGACFAVIQRARKVIPRLRDERFQMRIRKFKALKKRSWDEAMGSLVDDPEVELLEEMEALMANPFTWRRKQRIITARHGDLIAAIYEANDRVGTIKLEVVVER